MKKFIVSLLLCPTFIIAMESGQSVIKIKNEMPISQVAKLASFWYAYTHELLQVKEQNEKRSIQFPYYQNEYLKNPVVFRVRFSKAKGFFKELDKLKESNEFMPSFIDMMSDIAQRLILEDSIQLPQSRDELDETIKHYQDELNLLKTQKNLGEFVACSKSEIAYCKNFFEEKLNELQKLKSFAEADAIKQNKSADESLSSLVAPFIKHEEDLRTAIKTKNFEDFKKHVMLPRAMKQLIQVRESQESR